MKKRVKIAKIVVLASILAIFFGGVQIFALSQTQPTPNAFIESITEHWGLVASPGAISPVLPNAISNLPMGVHIPSTITHEVTVTTYAELRHVMTRTATQSVAEFGNANIAVRLMGNFTGSANGVMGAAMAIPTGRVIHVFSDTPSVETAFTILRPFLALGEQNARHFDVQGDSQLHLWNVTIDTSGQSNAITRGGVLVSGATARLYMHEGSTIAGSFSNVAQGANVTLTGSNAVFTMYGGEITRGSVSSATGAGGVMISNGARFYMHGGRIYNNRANISTYGRGGGIRITTGGSMIMTGGVVQANVAFRAGGGIAVQNGTLTLRMPQNGEPGYGDPSHPLPHIYRNHASTSIQFAGGFSGGGISIESGGIFNLYNGIIEYNFAPNAGGILVSDTGSSFVMHDGLITRNTATALHAAAGGSPQGGGGVMVHNGAHFTMYDGEIVRNVANVQGGGVILITTADNRFWMHGGRIAENNTLNTAINLQRHPVTATDFPHSGSRGGGVAVQTGRFYFFDGIIEDNAARMGGGLRPVNAQSSIQIGRPASDGYPQGNPTLGNNRSFLNGGGIAVNEGASVVMWYGEIYGNSAATVGGALSLGGPSITPGLPGFSRFEMHGGSIRNNTAQQNGGGIAPIGNNSHVTMYDGRIEGNRAGFNPDNPTVQGNGDGGGIILDSAGSWFRMYGGVLYNNFARNGGGIAVIAGTARVELYDGIIDSNHASPTASGSTHTTGRGGGIFLGSGQAFIEISDGVYIQNNVAHSGGGIFVNGTNANTIANVVMSGGVIQGNRATNLIESAPINDWNHLRGGGIALIGTARLEMTGGEIRRNFTYGAENTRTGGSGIWMGNNTRVEMSGDAQIHHNSVQPGDIASLGNSTTVGGVALTDNAILTMRGNSGIHNNVAIPVSGGGMRLWLNARVYMYDESSIHNNRSSNHGGGVVLEASTSLTMRDSSSIHSNIAGVPTMSANGRGGGIELRDNSVLNMYDYASIRGNIAQLDGGGVSMRDTSQLNMHDSASIDGNRSGYACFCAGRQFVTLGWLSTPNIPTALTCGGESIRDTFSPTHAGNGGGIYLVGANARLNMYDGTIQNNIATGSGGGVFATGATLTMYSGTIDSNHAYRHGGGVAVAGSALFTMHDGIISNNEQHGAGIAYGGGGINVNSMATYTTPSRFRMYGGQITDNEGIFGGGLRIGGPQSVAYITQSLSSGTLFYNNTARSSGGGIHAHTGATLTISSADIHNNTAANNGGGIQIGQAALILQASHEANRLSIYGNIAGGRGGGVNLSTEYVNTFALAHANISNNTATYGGGIYIGHNTETPGILNAISGSITNNHAARDGGGIFTENYLYAVSVPLTYFNNISISAAVSFGGNTAGNGSTLPPLNFEYFTTRSPMPIAGNGRSPNGANGTHLLNNYDINFMPYWIVSFDLVGGSHSNSSMLYQTVNHGADAINFTPTRHGHIFGGWDRPNSDLTNITENRRFVAQWRRSGSNPGDNPGDDIPTLGGDDNGGGYALNFSKSATPPHGSHIIPGSTVTYMIMVENTGIGPASNVVVTDTIPLGMRFIEGSDGYSFDNGIISWVIPIIEPGQVVYVWLQVVVELAPEGIYHIVFSNTAMVNGTNTNTVEHIMQGLIKNPDRTVVIVGEPINWTLRGFNNPLLGYAHNFGIVDLPSRGLYFLSGHIPAFANSDGITFDIRYRVYGSDVWHTHAGDISAGEPFMFTLPQPGDLFYTEVGLFFGTVPKGFGLGNEIVFTFIVGEDAPNNTLVNSFLIMYDENIIMGSSPEEPSVVDPEKELPTLPPILKLPEQPEIDERQEENLGYDFEGAYGHISSLPYEMHQRSIGDVALLGSEYSEYKEYAEYDNEHEERRNRRNPQTGDILGFNYPIIAVLAFIFLVKRLSVRRMYKK